MRVIGFLLFFISSWSIANCPLPDTFKPADKVVAISDVSLPKDEWIVLNIWAAWCAPCQKELPLLDKTAQSQERAFAVFALNLNDGETVAKEIFNSLKIENLKPISTSETDLLSKLGVIGLPYTAILYQQKIIAEKNGILKADDISAIDAFIHCYKGNE